MDLPDFKNSSKGLGGKYILHATWVAFHILVLAAYSRASWGSCRHYFRRARTCEHPDTEDESLMNLLFLGPSLV
jgi:hypothetical protein